jgi:hypothetical protein
VPNLLASGSEWLLGQQFASCSESVTLTIAGVSTTRLAIVATPSRERDGVIDGADVIHSDCDFVLRRSGDTAGPLPGDPERSWTLAHAGRSFRVVDWSDSDAWGAAVLLRCVKV